MEHRKLQRYRLLFAALISIICVMSLLNCDSINKIYLFFAHLLAIDPIWVSGQNATTVSNTGHIIICFMLTWTAFYVFQQNHFKAAFVVGSLACIVEFSQSFSMTRQANFEDVLLSFAGIFMASFLLILLKSSLFSPQLNK